MPLLSFAFDTSTTLSTAQSGYNITLDMSIPQQYIRLESFLIANNADAAIDLDEIYVKLPFLNNMSVHTNHKTDAIPLMLNKNNKSQIQTSMDYDFNLTDAIPKTFNVSVYDKDGEIYNAKSLRIMLNFVYNRNALF